MRWKSWRKKEFFVRDFWFVPTQYGLKGIKKHKGLQLFSMCMAQSRIHFKVF